MNTEPAPRAQVPAIYPYAPFPDEDIEQSIPERFEKQVRECGDRLAIVTDSEALTYLDLNGLANRLARKVLELRGGRVEAVALMFEHRGGALAAMLGVLKTGKFYVFLDPTYPSDRLTYMLSDSGAELIVTDTKNHPRAAEMAGERAQIVNLDHLDGDLSTEDPRLPISPRALSMLIYTSGSTGRPKGVMHSHQTVLVEARNLTNACCISKHDRWLLISSMSFANSVRTIYGALLNGSAIFPYDLKEKGFGELAHWMTSNRITMLRSLPTAFRNFMATLPPEQTFPDMRVIGIGGEAMPRSDLEYLNRHFRPPCVLMHGLGPTECFTVTWEYFPHGSRVDTPKLPIGYSLPDKDVLVLDDSGQEVASGELGELCVRSRYISLGYWRDAERTKAVFRPDPADPGSRIYRTGDLGMRLENGCLTHVGRADFQLKIRGFRIEVTEIEIALRALDGVRDAVVVGRPDHTGELRLIAYYVAAPDGNVTVSQMRQHLVRALPDYMVPGLFVAIAEIPKTPNGKIDRINLPEVSSARPLLDTPFAPPDTDLAKALAHIWAEALGVTEVGLHDDFLELGGDSLRAARIVSRVARSLRLQLPMTALFHEPTVAGMARFIERSRLDADELAPWPSAIGEPMAGRDRSMAADPDLAERRAVVGRQQRAAFVSLLRHAWHHSPFYRDLYSASGIEERDLDSIRPEDLPTVDKRLLMEHWDQVVTDCRLGKDALFRWVEQVTDPEVDYLDAFVVYTSSGSSGSKGLFACSRRDWQLQASAMASRLPEPVNDGHGKTRAAFYMATHGHFSAVSGAARAARSVYERCLLSLLEPDDVVVDRLNEFQPHQLHGYAGSIHRLAGLALAGTLRIAPRRIFVGGEPLTPAMERRIADAWAVPLYESYAAAESKFIAYRESGQADMAVVDELNLLEVLDDAGRPVTGPGTGRAVLTNLVNRTQPLIRYELGDVIGCGPGTAASPFKTVAIVAGKVLDALPISLRDGTPAAIDGLTLRSLFSLRGLTSIQFVARPGRVRIVYVGEGDLDAVIRTEFQRLLDGRGAAPMALEMERVAHIPADPRTGKHRQVVMDG